MTALTVLPIVELHTLDSRLGRPLSRGDSFFNNLSLTTSQIAHQTPVVWSDASQSHDSARGDRPKNSIQTP